MSQLFLKVLLQHAVYLYLVLQILPWSAQMLCSQIPSVSAMISASELEIFSIILQFMWLKRRLFNFHLEMNLSGMQALVYFHVGELSCCLSRSSRLFKESVNVLLLIKLLLHCFLFQLLQIHRLLHFWFHPSSLQFFLSPFYQTRQIQTP